MASGVERFVNISTDKAANPCSVLGYSKRVAERLTAECGRRATTGTYLSVRFGNVLGSRGSFIHAFRSQIEHGGPVTVTDPDVTRFFMTVPEAVELVIQAGAIGRSGEVLVLDMGQPVRIDDVARRMVRQSGREIHIVYTGLRAGEKLHEELFGSGERDDRTTHPSISHADVPPLPFEALYPWDACSFTAEELAFLTTQPTDAKGGAKGSDLTGLAS
jgi:dTDP-glucose 4,6-dehydratase